MEWILAILIAIIAIILYKLKSDSKKFENLLLEQKEEIKNLRSQNLKLEEELKNFTEIGSDSKQLNDTVPQEEQELHIAETLETIVEKGIADTNLDSEQKYIFDLMTNSNKNLFVTGKAGTGKSYLLRLFVELARKKTLVMAPTGIAALNANGVTIHSVFGFHNLVNISIDNLNEDTLRLKSENRKVLKNVETILIDEISMVRSDVFQKMDKIMKLVNRCNLPFGGKQIILFGDLYQLPPVVKRNEIKYLKDNFSGKYFFNTKAYKEAEFKFFELSINHRQKNDELFFDILNEIREGKLSDEGIGKLNERNIFEPNELRRIIRILPLKNYVDRINKNELAKISAPEYEFKSNIIYHRQDITFDIENNMPISETLKLKLGALVMMVTNDENHRWVNGTLGIVSSVNATSVKVTINEREYEVSKATFEQQEAKYEDGQINYETVCEVEQYPIVLAYAITIHKSQGMTYKRIACDVSKCFESGQAYVALSRCTTLDGLYLLEKINSNALKVDNEIIEFYKTQKSSIEQYV
jgi:ATP-dependent exoDNAse (exonuclease V) alpha subunit